MTGLPVSSNTIFSIFAYMEYLILFLHKIIPDLSVPKSMKSVVCLAFIFAVVSFSKVQAQKQYEEGYVIINSQDTLRGFVNYLNWSKNPESVQFKPTPESPEQVLGLQDISGFFVHDEHYVKALVKVDDTPTKIEELTYSRDHQTHEQTVFYAHW